MKNQLKAHTRKSSHWLLIVFLTIAAFVLSMIYFFVLSRTIPIALYRDGGLIIETNELNAFVGNQEKFEEVYRKNIDLTEKCLRLRFKEINIVNPVIKTFSYHRLQIFLKSTSIMSLTKNLDQPDKEIKFFENIIFNQGDLLIADSSGEKILTNEHLANADFVLQNDTDGTTTKPVVVLLLNEEGKKTLGLHLLQNQDKKIQIFLDANFLGEISTNEIYLTGKITIPFGGENLEESILQAKQTAAILNGGPLPSIFMTKNRTVYQKPKNKNPNFFLDWLFQKND